MDRPPANLLRILGIIAIVFLVILAGYWPLTIAWLILMMGGLSQRAAILHPLMATGFVGAILLVIAIVTAGVVIIRRLAKEIVLGPAKTEPSAPMSLPASAAPGISQPSPAKPRHDLIPRLSAASRTTIDRLVLALGAQIAVSAITMFQLASRPLVPRSWTLMLLPPFILSQVPNAILIYVLLKRPGRRAFTFLTAMLAFSILQTLSNPVILMSYRQIYLDHPVRLFWPVLSGLIFVVMLILSYKAIQQTGLWPKPASAILVTVATFFYFFLVREITPYLYRLWG